MSEHYVVLALNETGTCVNLVTLTFWSGATGIRERIAATERDFREQGYHVATRALPQMQSRWRGQSVAEKLSAAE